MVKCAWIAVFVLVVVAGSASAQNQVRLDPGVDGAIFNSIGGSSAIPFIGDGPSVMWVGIGSSYYSFAAYVLKFDVSGIDRVLDAKLVLYIPYVNFPDAYFLAWFDGGNESVSPSTVNLNDIPTEAPDPHFLYYEGGPISTPPGFPYYGAYWDITDELNSDLPSGHSDFLITLFPYAYGYGYGYMGSLYQPIFTTHLGQGYGDAQGSPFGPYLLYTPAAIPEPATLALLGLGLVSLGVAYRRRRKQAA